MKQPGHSELSFDFNILSEVTLQGLKTCLEFLPFKLCFVVASYLGIPGFESRDWSSDWSFSRYFWTCSFTCNYVITKYVTHVAVHTHFSIHICENYTVAHHIAYAVQTSLNKTRINASVRNKSIFLVTAFSRPQQQVSIVFWRKRERTDYFIFILIRFKIFMEAEGSYFRLVSYDST